MESRSYTCPRYRKDVKFISGLIRHIHACKILIILPNYQTFILGPILKYNINNYLDLPLDNFKDDINLRVSNNGKGKIRSADIDNDKEDIRPIDLEK